MAAPMRFLTCRTCPQICHRILGSVHVQVANYAKAKVPAFKGAKDLTNEKPKGPSVETDAAVLTTHCCGANIYKDGTDPLLQPDEEYPDWLWKLNLGPAKKLDEIEPGTREYFKRLRKENIWAENARRKGKKFSVQAPPARKY
ncbi:39S ribosomal protein L54, mitochondrial-like [Branchiostoma floridae]|uniref:Large ribosomal subunit protein mL54 n=1 Tax=Branchiostoma floridae TaxID=7739 RepID=C3YBA0_BRAFL|nr:39S ribosomal protein L54, mitochondrial-like [Branchiostoma floridae]|eukprot:XP_002606247.1 hypothetical protein BRAFLDRAFT_123709 [Branchiostoma floridae]